MTPTGPDAPERLGRFEVQLSLGVGGFAEVVQAYDPDLSSSVAIKLLADRWLDDDDARERFLAEARHLRRVRHPSVVSVFDIGELEDGRPYFVMELADRGTLDHRLRDPALLDWRADPAGLARLLIGLAGGLGAIHDTGLVHRDLTPRNILLRSDQGSAVVRGDTEGAEATSIGRSLVRDDEHIVVADLGLAKIFTEESGVSVMGGSSGFRAPEQLQPDGHIGPWSDVYAVSALLWRVFTGGALPDTAAFADRRDEVDPEWRELLDRGLDPDTTRRPPTVAALAAAALDILGMASGTDTPTPRGRRDQCPYRGLAAYEPEHAESFFGREALTASAVERLGDERLLAVLGASGSGKSSVVRAGIVPALAGGALTGSAEWPVVLMTPGTDPLAELTYQFRRVADAVGVSAPGDDHNDEHRWRLAADTICDVTGGLLLCVDQFEELFTHDSTGSEHTRFLDALMSVVDPEGSRVRLVFAMRADFYGDAARSPWLTRILNRNQILVGPMAPDELRRAVVGPAERAGLEVDAALIEAILAEVGADPGVLPLLGHALVETWRRREGRVLTLAGFRDAGGVIGAISQTAETVYTDELMANERDSARDVMLRMVTPGHGTPHTRRRVPLDQLRHETDPTAAEVVGKLVDARLVSTDETTAQIAHEALIREWPRLRGWIEDSIDDLRLRSNLTRAAAEWVDLDRDSAVLTRGTPLSAAREWAQRAPGQLGPTEQEFLDASLAAEEAERAHTARETRRQRLARGIAIGSVVAIVVVAVIAWFGVQRTRAVERSNAADARALETLGLVARLSAETDPALGLALGLEARALTDGPNPDAWLAVIQAREELAESGLVELASIDTGDSLTVTVSPDEQWAAVATRTGDIHMISIGERRIVQTIDAHEAGIPALAFRPDGLALASAGFDGLVQIRSVGPVGLEETPPRVIELGTLVWGIAWHPDGTRLATASEDGAVRVFDTTTGEVLAEPISGEIDMLRVAFDPTGTLLVASNGEGRVWGLDAATGDPVWEPSSPHRSDIWGLVFSPDGSHIATASSDGSARVLDAATGRVVEDPFIDERTGDPISQAVGAIQFTSDGTGLLAGTIDGQVVWWDRAAAAVGAMVGPSAGFPVLASGLADDTLVTLGRDQAARIWRLGAAVPVGIALPGPPGGTRSTAIAPDRSFVVTGDEVGTIRLHDPITGEQRAEATVSDSAIRDLAVSPDAATVAAATDAGEVVMFDVATRGVSAINAHPSRIRAIAFDPAGERLATGGKDGVVRIWATDGTMLAEFGDYEGDGVGALAWHPDGEELAVVGTIRIADVWHRDGDRRAGPVTVSTDAVQAVAFDTAGARIALGTGEETVTVWTRDLSDIVAGPFGTLPGGVAGLAFLDNDTTLLAAAMDGPIRMWDLESGAPIGQPISNQSGDTNDLAIEADGPLLATSSPEGDAWLYTYLDLRTACTIIDGVVSVDQPDYLGEGGRLRACEDL